MPQIFNFSPATSLETGQLAFERLPDGSHVIDVASGAGARFLLTLIARLQDIATVPMIDVRAYASWLKWKVDATLHNFPAAVQFLHDQEDHAQRDRQHARAHREAHGDKADSRDQWRHDRRSWGC
jgi:hypothetical protein